ncbi:hypothetical protein [Streptomyces sp. NPDC051000]|uniref:hypothetical protein n=1 Tax=Streptomyces sp. NPDC051000 TaxID=3155520 RepID=UPI0034117F6B
MSRNPSGGSSPVHRAVQLEASDGRLCLDASPANSTSLDDCRTDGAGVVAPGLRRGLLRRGSVRAPAAQGAREEVLRIAKSRLSAEFRTSAWNALRSTLGDEAIVAWPAPGGGFDLAKERLRDTRTRKRLFCDQGHGPTGRCSSAPTTSRRGR